MSAEALRTHCDGRMAGMRGKRQSWLLHWQPRAACILPRRYRWLVAPIQQRGNPINGNIIDSTGTFAARTLSSGMMAGITSPTRTWFKFRIVGFEDDDAVSKWLSECERRMMRVFQ